MSSLESSGYVTVTCGVLNERLRNGRERNELLLLSNQKHTPKHDITSISVNMLFNLTHHAERKQRNTAEGGPFEELRTRHEDHKPPGVEEK